MSNRRRLVLRPISPLDARALRDGFSILSPEDVRMRFLHPMTELTAEMAARFASPDPRREFALVLAEPLPPGEALVGGVARVIVTPAGDRAEFAILLARQLRGFGLGEYLMRKLILWSKRKRLEMLGGEVLSENAPMLALSEKLGFQRAPVAGEHGLMQVRLPLAQRVH